MGIRGLTTVIIKSNIGTTVAIENCQVIIDCYALIHYLYHSHQLDLDFGGQSFHMFQALEEFIQCLKNNSVKVIVVCDGQFDVKLKEQTKIKRMVELMQPNQQPNNINTKFSIEFYYAKMLSQICERRDYGFIVVKGEADRSIALLSHYLGAIVLSNDSDFYIFNSRAGYINLSTVRKEPGKSYTGSLVLFSEVADYLEIKKERMGIFAALCGNDFIDTTKFDSLLKPLYYKTTVPTTRVHSIAKFINSQDTESIINSFKKLLKTEFCADFDRIITHNSILYDVRAVLDGRGPEMEINELLNIISELKLQNLEFSYDTPEKQKKVVDYYYHRGYLEPHTICAPVSGVNFLSIPVQNFERASVNDISTRIRIEIYRLASILGECKPHICEYDREGKSFKRKNLHQVLFLNKNRIEISIDKIGYFKNALSVSVIPDGNVHIFENVSLNLDWTFIVFSLQYLIKNTKENYPDIVLKSFLLGLIKNVFYAAPQFKISLNIDKTQLPKNGLYLLHFIGSYTSIITNLDQLNTLLNNPISPFPLQFWFDGPLIVEAFIEISKNDALYLQNELDKMSISATKFNEFFDLCFK